MRRLLPVLLGACVADGGPEEAVPLPLPERFAAEVQPVLARGCANPSCHGNARRPLSVYAPDRFRADPAHTFLDEPLTADELRHNLASVGAFLVALDDPDACEVLTKPLAPEAGGMAHQGGVVFEDRDDPDYAALAAWVADALATGSP